MFQGNNSFFLEISKTADLLSMSVYENNSLSSTIKHYSQLHISSLQINRLCTEATSILKNLPLKDKNNIEFEYQLKKTGQLLWDSLLTSQVKDKLIHSAPGNLVLLLDEELVSIPWEFLYDGFNFLCLKFNLGRLVRAKADLRPVLYRGKASVPKMLILADPTNELKSAYFEGINIRNQFGLKNKEVKIDFKSSSIDTFYVKKLIRDYDIIHFAGHCEYDDQNTKNTGWQLADGRFCIKDIHALSGSGLPMPGLIFSNACHSAEVLSTAADKDYQEKTYSLAAAFLFSGVRHYIGAVWKIEDGPSFIFAKEFYSQLIKGKNIGEAVRLGRLKLVKQAGVASLHWAGYILYGDPNYVLFPNQLSSLKFTAIRKSVAKRKEVVKKICFVSVLIFLILILQLLLPFKKPSSLFLLVESKQLLKKGENNRAIEVLNNVIKADPVFLEAYPVLAEAFERIGDKDNALKYYFDYAFYSQKKNNFKATAKAYINIGWLYQLYGEYSKAFDFYNKAIALSQEHGDKLNEASSLRKLAVWYIDKEKYDKSLELLMKASEINRDRQNIYEHRYNLACDYFDIGLVFTDKDDYAAAKQFYQKSKELFDSLKLNSELSDYYFNLGEICLLEKQYEKALKLYLHGLDIDKTQGNIPAVASGYNMIAELYLEMGNFGQAEKYLSEALNILERVRVKPDLAAVYYNLAILYKQKGDKEKSKQCLRQAMGIYKEIDPLMYKKFEKEI